METRAVVIGTTGYYRPMVVTLTTALVAFFVALSWPAVTVLAASAQVGQLQDSRRFFDCLDQSVRRSSVGDGAEAPVAGFPYLRTNRFVSALKGQLRDREQWVYWVDWMRQLDLAARRKEIQNLAAAELEALATRLNLPADREVLQQRLAVYSRQMLDAQSGSGAFYAAVSHAAAVPEEYSTLLRVLGVYPLTVLPVAAVTQKRYREFEQWHRLSLPELPSHGPLVAYVPPQPLFYAAAEIRAILERAKRNPLLVPRPGPDDQGRLLRTFAPIVLQDQGGTYDSIGTVSWSERGLDVQTNQPTVYTYLSHAFWRAEPVIQLNYVFWYPGRLGPNAPWLERGKLDGLTVRISLNHAGEAVMAEFMNNCGCYHFFVPRRETIERIRPQPWALDPFVPRFLPDLFPEKRLNLRVVSGWHQVDHIRAGRYPAAKSRTYQLVPYERLETLPRFDGSHASMFSPRGIAKTGYRIEPVFFFPMGIHDVGIMRQRGHHAIKFAGRAHFDDPHLFDRNFEFRW